MSSLDVGEEAKSVYKERIVRALDVWRQKAKQTILTLGSRRHSKRVGDLKAGGIIFINSCISFCSYEAFHR